MKNKYRTEPEGGMLRIIALKDFADVKKGDKGGLIEKEDNLSQEGDCWVYDEAKVCGDAMVYENAQIFVNAEVSQEAKVFGNAQVAENAKIYGKAEVGGKTRVFDCAEVYGSAKVYGEVLLLANARVFENAEVCGYIWIGGDSRISGNVKLHTTFINLVNRSSSISLFIKDNEDYVVFFIKRKFCIISVSDIENIDVSISEKTLCQKHTNN